MGIQDVPGVACTLRSRSVFHERSPMKHGVGPGLFRADRVSWDGAYSRVCEPDTLNDPGVSDEDFLKESRAKRPSSYPQHPDCYKIATPAAPTRIRTASGDNSAVIRLLPPLAVRMRVGAAGVAIL